MCTIKCPLTLAVELVNHFICDVYVCVCAALNTFCHKGNVELIMSVFLIQCKKPPVLGGGQMSYGSQSGSNYESLYTLIQEGHCEGHFCICFISCPTFSTGSLLSLLKVKSRINYSGSNYQKNLMSKYHKKVRYCQTHFWHLSAPRSI